MLIANKEKQELLKHNRAVGILTAMLLEKILPNDSKTREYIINQGRLAGYLHDVGKANKNWQKWIKKDAESFDEETLKIDYFHNQESVLASFAAMGANFIKNNELAMYVVYNHHSPHRNVKEVNSESFKAYNNKETREFLVTMLSVYKEDGYAIPLVNEIPSTDPFSNALTNIILATNIDPIFTVARLAMIQADRWVSSLGVELNTINPEEIAAVFQKAFIKPFFTNNLKASELKISGLREQQIDVINKLKMDSINIVSAPAGSGKTTIALGFMAKTERNRSYFVAPRNAICKSLFHTIESDCERLGENVYKSTEVVTGLVKQDNRGEYKPLLESDLVIVNIDSVLGLFFNHFKSDKLLDLLTQPMAIDEYHELAQKNNALFYVFEALLKARAYLKTPTILISATPIYGWNLDVEPKPNVIEMVMTDNLDTEHHFHYLKDNKKTPQVKGSILVRRNTIAECQKHFGEGDVIVHSKYSDEDRKLKLNNLLKEFRENGDSKRSVHSTSMVESSLNISFDNLLIEVSSPSSFLQSLGRVRRFGNGNKKDASTVYLTVNESRSNNTYISGVYDDILYGKWIKFCESNIVGKTMKKSDVYSLINEFNKQNSGLLEGLVEDIRKSSMKYTQLVKHKSSGVNKKGNDKEVRTADGLRGFAGFFVGFIVGDELKVVGLKPSDKEKIAGLFVGGMGKYLQSNVTKAADVVKANSLMYSIINIPKKLIDNNIFRMARSSKSPIIMQINERNHGIEYHWDSSSPDRSVGVKTSLESIDLDEHE